MNIIRMSNCWHCSVHWDCKPWFILSMRRDISRSVICIFGLSSFTDQPQAHHESQSSNCTVGAASSQGASARVAGASELQPGDHETFVQTELLQQPLCGESRPHFFKGVATVRFHVTSSASKLSYCLHLRHPGVLYSTVAIWYPTKPTLLFADSDKAVQHCWARCGCLWVQGLSAAASHQTTGQGPWLWHRDSRHANHKRERRPGNE